MTSIPLPAVEFAAFMGLVLWLLFRPRRHRQQDASTSEARQMPDEDPRG